MVGLLALPPPQVARPFVARGATSSPTPVPARIKDRVTPLMPPTCAAPRRCAHTATAVPGAKVTTRGTSAVVPHPPPVAGTTTGDVATPGPAPQPAMGRVGGPLPTPVRVEALTQLLHNYPGKSYIVDGFTNGFDLGFQGTPCPLMSNNNRSVNTRPEVALAKVTSEVNLGRIAGPFFSPPFPNFKVSPLSLREKSTPGKFRLLHNLSYPYDSRSVNFNIPYEFSHLSYASVTDAISTINKLDTCYMAKADIAEAYRLLPIHPSCYNLLGFRLMGNYYFDQCLPMGASSSCAIFERFSDALIFILESVYNVFNTVKMLDDFLFIASSEEEC